MRRTLLLALGLLLAVPPPARAQAMTGELVTFRRPDPMASRLVVERVDLASGADRLLGEADSVPYLASDGRTLLTSADGLMELADIDTGGRWPVGPGETWGSALSPDGARLAIRRPAHDPTDPGGDLSIVDVISGDELMRLDASSFELSVCGTTGNSIATTGWLDEDRVVVTVTDLYCHDSPSESIALLWDTQGGSPA